MNVNSQMAPAINPVNIIILIAFFVVLLLAAYFLTKFVKNRALSKRMKTKPGKKSSFFQRSDIGKHISVVDRISIDRDKTILVVEFDGKYYLMTTAGQEIRLVDKKDIPREVLEAEEKAKREAEEAMQNDPAASYDVNGNDFFANFGGMLKERFGKVGAKVTKPFKRKAKKASFEQELKQKMQEAQEQPDKPAGSGQDAKEE